MGFGHTPHAFETADCRGVGGAGEGEGGGVEGVGRYGGGGGGREGVNHKPVSPRRRSTVGLWAGTVQSVFRTSFASRTE